SAEEAARNITEHFRRFNEATAPFFRGYKPRIYFRGEPLPTAEDCIAKATVKPTEQGRAVKRMVGSLTDEEIAEWAAQRIAEYYSGGGRG
ncbi:MAG TPA: hypothetical protein VFK27_05220, partial [Bacillales bacterium]|nr:hypothetical protein [Bacillales bacterium]